MARVLKVVEEAGAKVVLVGDAMQLQPIQAGAAFRAITERIGFAELSGVRRQSEQWARDASRLFARREVEQGLDAYVKRGHLIEAETPGGCHRTHRFRLDRCSSCAASEIRR